MDYMVLLYADATLEARPGAPQWDATMPAHAAFAERLREHGLEFTGGGLRDVSAATSLRVRDGERLVTDGPFAETKEQLWGFYRVTAPDLDTMIAVCAGMWEASTARSRSGP